MFFDCALYRQCYSTNMNSASSQVSRWGITNFMGSGVSEKSMVGAKSLYEGTGALAEWERLTCRLTNESGFGLSRCDGVEGGNHPSGTWPGLSVKRGAPVLRYTRAAVEDFSAEMFEVMTSLVAPRQAAMEAR